MNIQESVNIAAYRSEESLEKYSSYHLYPIEKYLFKTYYKNEDSILDLACGSGRTTLRLFENGFTNIKGVDLSDVLIDNAKKRFPYLKFETGDYCKINEQDNSYDHILISHNGIDYAFPEENRIKAITECARVLRKNGTLILSSHNIKALHFSPYFFRHYQRILWKIKNTLVAFKDKAYVLDLGMYTFYGSPEYVVTQIENQGFKLIEERGFRLSDNSIFNTYISPYVHYVFKKI